MPKDETFDADAFMQSTVDQPMATDFEMVPPGMYQAMIDDFDSSAVQKYDFEYKSGPNAGQPGSMVKLSLPFSIQDPAVLAKMEREKVIVFQDLTLDMNGGQLDWGKNKNVRLGQARAAANQNQPGPWSIFNLKGAGPVMVQVAHEEFERRDGSKGKKAAVVRVAPLRS